jgi:hypothetical protein
VPLFLDQEQAGNAFRHQRRIPTQAGPAFESRLGLFQRPGARVQRLAEAEHEPLFQVVGPMNGYSAQEMAERPLSAPGTTRDKGISTSSGPMLQKHHIPTEIVVFLPKFVALSTTPLP